jgi:hypothetical protein
MDLRSKDAIESSKQHEIDMNNILIAEFMLIDAVDIDTWFEENTELRYHTSWDWLMPVVEKIESLGFEFMITETRCAIKNNTDNSIEEVYHCELLFNKRECVYMSVVEFIKWYNKENK